MLAAILNAPHLSLLLRAWPVLLMMSQKIVLHKRVCQIQLSFSLNLTEKPGYDCLKSIILPQRLILGLRQCLKRFIRIICLSSTLSKNSVIVQGILKGLQRGNDYRGLCIKSMHTGFSSHKCHMSEGKSAQWGILRSSEHQLEAHSPSTTLCKQAIFVSMRPQCCELIQSVHYLLHSKLWTSSGNVKSTI